ncbi:SDR family oxidoreductase, partial [Phytoactinopolyspora endophytica]|uniref:SDR family oxidoreductase n=1 Tax=Phytoactinopolyspora endophytica TaxID=1642495 RepID=UPI00197C2E85
MPSIDQHRHPHQPDNGHSLQTGDGPRAGDGFQTDADLHSDNRLHADDDLYLVVGATGAQGAAVARGLVSDGRRVRGLTRSPAGFGRLPDGVEPAVADLADPAQLAGAFADVTHVSLTLPMVFEPALVASYVDNVAKSAAAAGVRRLVFNSGTGVPDAMTDVTAFETRRGAAATLLSSDVPTVVLHPLIYLENLCSPWVAGPAMHEGVVRYPLPAGLPVAWLCHDDLGAATVAALTRDGLAGTTLRIGGPDAVTGPELADEIGVALGRTVEYAEQDVDEFERGLVYAIGADAAAGVASTYRWLATDDG